MAAATGYFSIDSPGTSKHSIVPTMYISDLVDNENGTGGKVYMVNGRSYDIDDATVWTNIKAAVQLYHTNWCTHFAS